MNQYKRNTNNPDIRELENPIDFRSDTVTLPSKDMLKSIQKAKLGDDVYGEDIEVLEVGLNQIPKLINNGEINHSLVISDFYLLDKFKK